VDGSGDPAALGSEEGTSLKTRTLAREIAAFARGCLSAWVSMNPSRAGARLRGILYRTSAHVAVGVQITRPANFRAGKGCALYHYCVLANDGGWIEMGERSHLGPRCLINAVQGRVTIGRGVAVGPGTSIFSYSNHFAAGAAVVDCKIQRDVTIGDNVFIGAHCAILPGTVIEDNVVVGAGAVVKGTLAADTLYAGVPARPIRSITEVPET